MMIPITRKEKYINEIVGVGNTAPETPQTREELFFADILGEVVAPSPITRAEKYLAKIANEYSGELPEPVTRIERFLARAAGMNVSTPTPVTREEMFWADYAFIVEKETSGIPPLAFNAIAGTLKNYRIYGQTSRNLFDVSKAILVLNKTYNENGNIVDTINSSYYDYFIPIDGNKTYTINAPHDTLSRVHFFDANKNWISRSDILSPVYASTFTSPINSKYIIIQVVNSYNDEIVTHNPEDLMLNTGSTALPYEPYGESVGDRTGNLFDVSNATRDVGHTYNESGVYVTTNASNTITGFIAVDENTTYTIKSADYPPYRVHYFDINKQWISRSEALYGAQPSLGMIVEFTTPNNSKYILMQEINSTRMSISTIMLNLGSTALPYEPYGYKIPVTNNSETANIYLDEPLAKSGNNADYIDYATQKRHNSDGTESSVALPEIAVAAGTNTLTVGTEVQPSDVYIKYEGER